MILGFTVAAPFAFALAVRLIPRRDTRRAARLVLAVVAALLPLGAIGSVDGLSLVFTGLVSILGLMATFFSAGILADDWTKGDALWSRKPVFFILLGAFWSSMLLVVLAGNFALLWLGISLTTLTTAFLVGYSGEAVALEAAWKYLVLCSVGIALALLGIVVLAHVAIASGVRVDRALSWVSIAAHAPSPPPALARLAVGLMVIGFATKAGLVPMHAWLPDAHSKAPAPISALLSGVLVSCALYAIMRTVGVAEMLGVGSFAQGMLISLGVASTIVAGALMLAQRDLKRLLAYSTIEHAGIVALALGFGGPLGFFAALFHLINHAFAKSGAFFAAGLVQRQRNTTSLGELQGLWESGASGRLLLAAVVAISGMPPFGLFLSELLVVAAGMVAHRWVPLGLGLFGMILAFSALSRAAIGIESGRAKPIRRAAADQRTTTEVQQPPLPSGARLIPRAREKLEHPAWRLSSLATTTVLVGSLFLAAIPWTQLAAPLQAVAQAMGAP
jgi:hydrogenase-4 component F